MVLNMKQILFKYGISDENTQTNTLLNYMQTQSLMVISQDNICSRALPTTLPPTTCAWRECVFFRELQSALQVMCSSYVNCTN